jgi:prolyl-tRNA synthetase
VRVEVGPRDLAEGVVTIVRRDLDSEDSDRKRTVGVMEMSTAVVASLEAAQESLWRQAAERLDANIIDVADLAEAVEVAATGFARLPWSVVGEQGEDELASAGVTVRCIQTPDGGVPESDDEPDVVAVVGRAY